MRTAERRGGLRCSQWTGFGQHLIAYGWLEHIRCADVDLHAGCITDLVSELQQIEQVETLRRDLDEEVEIRLGVILPPCCRSQTRAHAQRRRRGPGDVPVLGCWPTAHSGASPAGKPRRVAPWSALSGRCSPARNGSLPAETCRPAWPTRLEKARQPDAPT